jgi:hypothetical protein
MMVELKRYYIWLPYFVADVGPSFWDKRVFEKDDS